MAGYTVPLVRQVRDSLIVSTTLGVKRASRHAYEGMPSVIKGLGQALDRRALPDNWLLETNKTIATAAQRAMAEGYRGRLPRGSIGYRGDARLTGKLGAALHETEAMTAGTSARVISFVNDGALRKSARHWYRINYGAAGPNLSKAGGEHAQTFTINLNQRPFMVLRDDAAPDPISYLPRSFYWIKGPVNMLIAGGRRARAGDGTSGARVSHTGARAAHFTDLGLQVVARQFGPAYDRLFRRFLDEAPNRARLEKKDIHVVTDVRFESTGWTVDVH